VRSVHGDKKNQAIVYSDSVRKLRPPEFVLMFNDTIKIYTSTLFMWPWQMALQTVVETYVVDMPKYISVYPRVYIRTHIYIYIYNICPTTCAPQRTSPCNWLLYTFVKVKVPLVVKWKPKLKIIYRQSRCVCVCVCVQFYDNNVWVWCISTYVSGAAPGAGVTISRWDCSLFYPHRYIMLYCVTRVHDENF